MVKKNELEKASTGRTFEEIIVKPERKSEVDKILEDREKEAVRAYKKIQLDRLVAEEEQKLKKIKSNPENSPQAQNYVQSLFVGRNPEEVKQIISSLGSDEIQKLALIANASNPNNQAMLTSLLSRKDTSINDTVQLIKTVVDMNKPPPQQSNLLQGVASLITALNKQTQPQKQANPYVEILKATLDELREQRKVTQQQQMMMIQKEIAEIKNRPTAMAEIAHDSQKFKTYQEMFGGGQRIDEIALKLEDMRQKERLDNRKLDFEERKLQREEESTGKLYDTVKEVLKGPVGETIKNIGTAGADRVRGSKNPQGQQIVRAQCSSCGGVFPVNPELPTINCPLCGVQLSRDKSEPEPEPIIKEVPPEPEVVESREEPKRAAKRKKT